MHSFQKRLTARENMYINGGFPDCIYDIIEAKYSFDEEVECYCIPCNRANDWFGYISICTRNKTISLYMKDEFIILSATEPMDMFSIRGCESEPMRTILIQKVTKAFETAVIHEKTGTE